MGRAIGKAIGGSCSDACWFKRFIRKSEVIRSSDSEPQQAVPCRSNRIEEIKILRLFEKVCTLFCRNHTVEITLLDIQLNALKYDIRWNVRWSIRPEIRHHNQRYLAEHSMNIQPNRRLLEAIKIFSFWTPQPPYTMIARKPLGSRSEAVRKPLGNGSDIIQLSSG